VGIKSLDRKRKLLLHGGCQYPTFRGFHPIGVTVGAKTMGVGEGMAVGVDVGGGVRVGYGVIVSVGVAVPINEVTINSLLP
jgi:hypothetical protein